MDTLITLATDSGAPGAAGAVCHALRPDVRPATVRSHVSPSFHTVSRDTMMVSDTREQYQKDCEDRAERYLVFAREIARSSGVPCESAHVVNDHPYEGIIDAARTKGCDLFFMASHGREGVAALVLGNETTKVLTHSKIPTLVCR